MGWKTALTAVTVLLAALTPLFAQESFAPALPSARSLETLRHLDRSGAYETAEALAEAWVGAVEEALGPEHPEVRSALAAAGRVVFERGEVREAEELFERELALARRHLNADHPDRLDVENRFTLALLSGDDRSAAEEAVELLQDVVSARERLSGSDHPATLAVKTNLATAMLMTSDRINAQRLREEVLAARLRTLGSEHPDTARAKVLVARIARIQLAESEEERARQLDEEALSTLARRVGEDDPSWPSLRANPAAALYALDPPDAESVVPSEVRRIFAAYPVALAIPHEAASMLGALAGMVDGSWGAEETQAIQRRVDRAAPQVEVPEFFGDAAWTMKDIVIVQERRAEMLADQRWVLGEVHPDVFSVQVLSGAAFKYFISLLMKTEKAPRDLESLVGVFALMLGFDHPDTLLAQRFLAGALRRTGELHDARLHFAEVHAAYERVHGEAHPETLAALHELATTLQTTGELDEATRHFEAWLEQRRNLLGPEYRPETIGEANTLFLVGSNRRTLSAGPPRDSALLDRAFAAYRDGLGACEAQAVQIDPSETVQGLWRDLCGEAYRTTVSVAVEGGHPDEALETLERYRARHLQMQVAWRHGDDWSDVPEATAAELASIAERYDELTRQIVEDYPQPRPAHFEEQAELRKRRERIRGDLLRERLGGWDLPEPLRVDTMRRQLDPGTLLLAYSLGAEGGHLFVLDRDGPLEVHSVDALAAQLWIQVGRLREIDREGDPSASRQEMSRWLYETLLAPAQTRIDRAERLLIVPDGPLHFLHFAALTRAVDDDPRGWRYVIEQVPIHTAQSTTVYAELRSRRQPASDAERPVHWVGFGDPVVPGARRDDPSAAADKAGAQVAEVVRSAVERGLLTDLAELLFSQREVREIADLFDDGRAMAYVDREATEDRARELLAQARIAHFAVHGLADPDHPMDSFLALSLLDSDGGGHNGLLQAWEIVDQLRLDADLVVLSACETGFGPNRTGEGVISLGRAFQVAGARTVLASQWAVNDASTAELMIRFYRHLLAGQSKDEALRSAQLELIHERIPVASEDGEVEERNFSPPYHWAAFQLIGDWQ